MNRLKMLAAWGLFLLCACDEGLSNESVGDMCTPEILPSSPGGSGFAPDEWYVETSSQCSHGGVCLVDRLDNHSDGGVPADPTVLCDATDPKPGCVNEQDLERSVYCSCPCNGGSREHLCTCPGGYVCRELASVRLGTLFGSFCVRPSNR